MHPEQFRVTSRQNHRDFTAALYRDEPSDPPTGDVEAAAAGNFGSGELDAERPPAELSVVRNSITS
jgi:hypothetical protein